MKKCVFAGSFDPFTVGHAETVARSLALFDEVVIAVAQNPEKQYMFPAKAREEMIRAVYREEPRVRVVLWEGVAADLLLVEHTPFYVRGIRNIVDFEYETADYYASRKLNPDMIPIYLPTGQELLHVSSTIVRNSIRFGKPYEEYVPKAVYEYIGKRGQ